MIISKNHLRGNRKNAGDARLAEQVEAGEMRELHLNLKLSIEFFRVLC